MLNYITRLLQAAALAAAMLCPPAQAADIPANALLVVPSETAFDRKFQDFLDKRGAKLLESHPPSVFVGHIPQELDKELEERFGARVYRERVDDWASFARYGEKAVFAVNAWNKRFVDDPPEAPLVVSAKVQRAGRRGGLTLTWNEVMKAGAYRLQISRSADFEGVQLETLLSGNRFTLYPFFLEDGVYYWRVAPVVRLNTGESSELSFSGTYSFAVSNPRVAPAVKRPAAPAQKNARLSKGALHWQDSPGDRYFRLQLSNTQDFSAPLADVFTDTCSYRLSGLPLDPAGAYYLRVMASDGKVSGDWSEPAAVLPEAPASRSGRKGKQR